MREESDERGLVNMDEVTALESSESLLVLSGSYGDGWRSAGGQMMLANIQTTVTRPAHTPVYASVPAHSVVIGLWLRSDQFW